MKFKKIVSAIIGALLAVGSQSLVFADNSTAKNETVIPEEHMVSAYADNMCRGSVDGKKTSKIENGYMLGDKKTVKIVPDPNGEDANKTKITVDAYELTSKKSILQYITMQLLNISTMPKLRNLTAKCKSLFCRQTVLYLKRCHIIPPKIL